MGEALAAGEEEVIVATPDRALAARIIAQLRDAGVDADEAGVRAAVDAQTVVARRQLIGEA